MMTCGRWAAVLAGVVLLLPGLCSLGFGCWGMTTTDAGTGIAFIVLGGVMLWLAWWLIFKVAREPEPSLKDPIGESAPKEPPKTE